MLQLYDYFRSSASFRVRIALNLKELVYKNIPVHLLNNGGEQNSLEYQAINPQGLVPTLQDDDKIISQSLAIIEYLEDIYPEKPLLPADAYQKAWVRSFALSIAADMHPLNNLRVLQYLIKEFRLSEEQKSSWYKHWIEKGFGALEKSLVTLKDSGDFCFGNTPTLADVCLIPQVYNARRYAFDLSAYPTISRIDAHCQTLPAFLNAWPQEAVI
jgi:maleylacetoacetate isomerase